CLRAALNQDYPQDKYEIIIVDDGSTDNTAEIVNKAADKVVKHPGNLGLRHARKSGIAAAKGEIIVNMDSDVLIKSDTLTKIVDYFSKHSSVQAVTGLLSKDHPNTNFFSQYKNLYMNYVFNKLPERVAFLYGSIHALRKEVARIYGPDRDIGEDTMFGQELVSGGKQIAFLKDLEVIHLKKYTFFSFIKNDFEVPFNWAKIFLKYRGWRQLGRNKTGYAHSPKEQLLSVALAPAIILLVLAAAANSSFLYPAIAAVIAAVVVWFFLNRDFFRYLAKEKGPVFGMLAIFVTFLDNIIMALGIVCGFCEGKRGKKGTFPKGTH
ncbi:MAG: glycosyltransferase, partial [Candidatus Omnitrophica bacterium]|nr:glycosyltransferase [Candidatus Omnitrophota bacterium]